MEILDKEEVVNRLLKYLENTYESDADVEGDDIREIYDIMNVLFRYKYQSDYNNDHPIGFRIWNDRKYENIIPFPEVPKLEWDEEFNWKRAELISTNMKVLSEALSIQFQLRRV